MITSEESLDMEQLVDRIKKLEYHQQLLLNMCQVGKFPFYEMIIKNDLSEEEVQELFSICEQLSLQYEQEKEEGFVYFTPLLSKFVQLLNPKLDPKETIYACLSQGLYRPLMEVLKRNL